MFDWKSFLDNPGTTFADVSQKFLLAIRLVDQPGQEALLMDVHLALQELNPTFPLADDVVHRLALLWLLFDVASTEYSSSAVQRLKGNPHAILFWQIIQQQPELPLLHRTSSLSKSIWTGQYNFTAMLLFSLSSVHSFSERAIHSLLDEPGFLAHRLQQYTPSSAALAELEVIALCQSPSPSGNALPFIPAWIPFPLPYLLPLEVTDHDTSALPPTLPGEPGSDRPLEPTSPESNTKKAGPDARLGKRQARKRNKQQQTLQTEQKLPASLSSELLDQEGWRPSGHFTEPTSSELWSTPFAPAFHQLPPPVLDVAGTELQWIDLPQQRQLPVLDRSPVADQQLPQKQQLVEQAAALSADGTATVSLGEAQSLLERAKEEPLAPFDLRNLLAALNEWPALLIISGFSPEALPPIVEKNSEVAFICLLHLSSCDRQFRHYLLALENIELCVRSLELVNRLCKTIDLPTDFLKICLSKWFIRCSALPPGPYQSRIVALLCLFMQSLRRQLPITIEELLPEILVFCLEFSRVREASALFQQLK